MDKVDPFSPTPVLRVRTGLALAIVSPALLGSAPLQGALFTSDYKWIRPIAFSGVSSYLLSSIASFRDKRTKWIETSKRGYSFEAEPCSAL